METPTRSLYAATLPGCKRVRRTQAWRVACTVNLEPKVAGSNPWTTKFFWPFFLQNLAIVMNYHLHVPIQSCLRANHRKNCGRIFQCKIKSIVADYFVHFRNIELGCYIKKRRIWIITWSNWTHCEMSKSQVSVTSIVSTLPSNAQTIFAAWMTCFGRSAGITAVSVQPRY